MPSGNSGERYAPWAGDMIPRETGPGRSVRHSGGGGVSYEPTVRLEWVSREKDASGKPLRTRRPLGVKLFSPAACFMAAGRPYFGLSMLTARRRQGSPWARDAYGRDVLVLTERFPCFDSADYRHEKRYFRWYLLCRKGKFTCVCHTDGTPLVTVTEDVRDLERGLWRQVRDLGCFGPEDEPVAPETAGPGPEGPAAPYKRQWAGDMIPRRTGPGGKVEHSGGGYVSCGSLRLEWVSRETDGSGLPLERRTPQPVTEAMPESAFTAAGKTYESIGQLTCKWEGGGPWALDIYGRAVLEVKERFPCFDSYDYLHENRYFRWLLLCQGGKLTCVYHTDGTDAVTVTEDVLELEEPCWKEIERERCFEEDEG